MSFCFLLLFVVLFPFCSPVKSENLTADWSILLSLKQHWGNPPSLDRWNSNTLPCDWPEIECTSGAITGLYLLGMDINGTIPTNICWLKDLRKIDLRNNCLSGTIPDNLYTCSELETLNLSDNLLSGTIPGKLFHMKRLLNLQLSKNILSGEIPTPTEAFNLEFIDFSRNHLNGSIPAELFHMKRLRILLLSDNILSGEIPTLTRTEALNLEYLDLSHNHFNGSIPEDMGNLHNLLILDLSMNFFGGQIHSKLFRMHQLSSLMLGYNNLSGELPKDVHLFSLKYLNLTHNHLNGTVPQGLGDIQGLQSVDLSDNQLSGNITATVNTFLNTTTLRVCSNNFSGRIPYKFVESIFNENCFDQPNICSGNRKDGVPPCPSGLRSEYRSQECQSCGFHPPAPDSEKRGRDFTGRSIIVLTLSVVVTLMTLGLFICLVKKFWSRGQVQEINISRWKTIPFHKLDFYEWEIVWNLTEENLIGQGGSGKVYRVFVNSTSKTFAVKSIRNERKSDDRLEKEFLAETRVLGTIKHNNIVKLLCCISTYDLKLLVYEHFKNGSLDHWLHYKKRNESRMDISFLPLDWPRRLHIAIGAAQGIYYLHHGSFPPIIHRDIKSSNILLDSEFNAKIADFGLARILSPVQGSEPASAVAGTFGYIAPEYGRTSKFSIKSDVYSFGVVLLELTTGRKPVTPNEPMNLAGWAWSHLVEKSPIVDALDEQIKEPCYFEEMTAVFKLGLVCTLESPSRRPFMKDVLRILQNCRKNPSSS